MKTSVVGVLVAAVVLATPRPVAAHCDSLDGPVVLAGKHALATGDAAPALAWIPRESEGELLAQLRKTLEARRAGPRARELVDRYFLETLVRLHRAGEGEPYTGLKPARDDPDGLIGAADRALETGSAEELGRRLRHAVDEGQRIRFERALAARSYPLADVEAGRAFVRAYVEYIHFVEQVAHLAGETASPQRTSTGTGSSSR